MDFAAAGENFGDLGCSLQRKPFSKRVFSEGKIAFKHPNPQKFRLRSPCLLDELFVWKFYMGNILWGFVGTVSDKQLEKIREIFTLIFPFTLPCLPACPSAPQIRDAKRKTLCGCPYESEVLLRKPPVSKFCLKGDGFLQ